MVSLISSADADRSKLFAEHEILDALRGDVGKRVADMGLWIDFAPRNFVLIRDC